MKRSLIFILIFVCCLATAQNGGNVRYLSVDECLKLASDQNIAVKNTHLDYLSARMQKREVLANYFPVISLDAVGFQSINPLVRIGIDDIITGNSDAANNLKYTLKTNAEIAGINTTYETLSNAYRAGVSLMQPIYSGGRIVTGNRLAALGIEAASLKENIARRDAASEVESKYWRVVSLEEKLAVLDEAITLADSLLKDTRSAQAAGLLTDEQGDKVMMGRQELKAKRIRLTGGILLAKMDLCEAVGIDCAEASGLRLTERLEALQAPGIYWKDPSEVIEKMEESKLLDLAVKQKTLEKQLAMGEALPQIGVGATYGYSQVIGTPQANGAVYATVKIPLTDWSKAGNKMKRIDYQREKAENDREHYVAMLELQLRQFWVEVEASWEELALKEESVDYAFKAEQRAAADASAGLGTYSTLMEKQVALANARCELVDAQIAYRNALTEYLARSR